MKKIISQHYPLVIFIIFTVIFYSNLFIPRLSIYFTPDLGRSDITHLSFPLHDFFSNVVKSGKIPLWINKIGTGVPLLFSGQVGIINIINYLLLYFFSSVYSFNLIYVLFTFICLISTYGFA